MTPEPTEGFTVESTPAKGPRRRVRFEPVSDGGFERVTERYTGRTWVSRGREPVDDVVMDACKVAVRVHPDPLPDLPIAMLRAEFADDEGGIHAGEVLGFCCTEYGQADETLVQTVHDENCDLAGEHGRAAADPSDQLAVAGGGERTARSENLCRDSGKGR